MAINDNKEYPFPLSKKSALILSLKKDQKILFEDHTLTEYLTEQEQIEILKNWIKQYSLVILIGIIAASLTIFGWRYWQQRQAKIFTHASSIYDEMLAMRTQNDSTAAIAQAKKLFTDYPQTTYGQIAAFMLARDAILKSDYPQAEDYLRWFLNHSHIAPFRQIARIRLARVLIAEQKPKQSIQLLDEKVDDKSFNGLTDEVKGDAYLSMKDIPKARQFYQQALTELPNAEVVRPILQMKYDNLATIHKITIN